MVDLYYFTGLIFTHNSTYTHYVLYNRAFFVGLVLVVRQSSMKIGPLENFPLYGILDLSFLGLIQKYRQTVATAYSVEQNATRCTLGEATCEVPQERKDERT